MPPVYVAEPKRMLTPAEVEAGVSIVYLPNDMMVRLDKPARCDNCRHFRPAVRHANTRRTHIVGECQALGLFVHEDFACGGFNPLQ